MTNAEKAVIGCLIMDAEVIDHINLKPEMFRDADLGLLFGEIKKLTEDGKAVDPTVLKSRLNIVDMDNLLVECVESMTVSTDIGQYAEIVANDYKARQLMSVISIKPDGKNIDNQIALMERQLQILSEGRNDTSETIGEIANRFKGERFTPNRKQGIKTGIDELDRIVQGMDDGDLILIAARPSVGKTAFSTQIALHTSKTVNTALISLEMSKEQLYDRIIAKESGIELNRIRRALNCTGEERDLFDEANTELQSQKLRIVDNINTVGQIYSFLKRHKIELAIIDYAQLIQPEGRYKGNRYAEVGEISHGLKTIAKRLNIPIIILSQLNRVADALKEPTMSEVRESGDFEQDASVIILLWNKTEDRVKKGLKVDKNRNGEVGKMELFFDGKLQRFSEFTEQEDNPFG